MRPRLTGRAADFFADRVMPWLAIGLLISIVMGVPIGIYVVWTDEQRPTFELKKDDWACTRQGYRSTVSASNSVGAKGNVGVVLTPTVEVVCTQYTLREAS